MRSFGFLGAAALVALAGPALAQSPADPAQQVAVDTAYVGRCEAKTTKEICSCVVGVADSQFGDPTERQIFYDFMMGDVDKAKSARDVFEPQRKMMFNVALQKADVLLGQQCDKLKPKAPDAAPQQPADKTP